MSRNCISITAEPEVVFDVLDDAYAYPRWVLGARRIRRVDDSWPEVGAQFHHALGTAVAELHDSSKIIDRERPRRIVLEVRFRPTGVARVEIIVVATASGSDLTIEETPLRGPFSRLPRFATDPMLTLRNAVSLQRLRREVERSHHDAPAS